ncbi:DNA glycosylase [Daedalea quercina L-15889]|uniref:DNA glycosylase n=1 Tax=Daedalea quercina L-15889 TaxID=1314783 RepID=A0A165N7Z1_9APHY|nr:DNA glycosylase [Daedalea quercina L-15889]
MDTQLESSEDVHLEDCTTATAFGDALGAKFAYSKSGIICSTSTPPVSASRIQTEPSPEKSIPEPTKRSTRSKRATVKQELLDSSSAGHARRSTRSTRATVKQEVLGSTSTTLAVTEVKRKVVKKKVAAKTKRGYAPPEQYAHLQFLPEFIKEGLDILFCGINPAVRSAQIGHHYGHRSNHFWSCLVESGLTSGEHVTALDDHTIADKFNFGMTNIVERPSAEAAELSKKELAAGVPSLLRKIAEYRPRIVALVGKVIWDAMERSMKDIGVTIAKKTGKTPFPYDIQQYKVVHQLQDGHEVSETLFFVLPSSSARVAAYQKEDKIKLFALLKRRLHEVKARSMNTSSMAVVPTPAPR